jgi:sn-glycerol 3-phosphate transport system substrate-binding protein
MRSLVIVVACALLASAVDARAKTEIHFWHAMDGQLGAAVNELVRQFNESQAEFEIKAQYKGTYSDVLTAALSAYHRKSPPHIAQIYEIGTQSMVMSGATIPLHRLMLQHKIGINSADIIDAVMSYYATEGRLSSMPFNSSSPILYYNKDAFRKAGLPETPPTTWKDVENASRKLLAAGAARCGFTTSEPSWTMLENTFAWHNQPFATNDNGYRAPDTKLLINSDFGRMHIEALVKWQKEDIYSYGGRGAQADAKFINGDCAMLVQSSAVIGGFAKAIKFGWGTGQLPHWGPPYPRTNSIVGGATLWVLRGHPPGDYRGVAQFMEFIAAPHRQTWWAATTGYVPVTKSAIKNLRDSAFFAKNPEMETALNQLLNARPTAYSRGLRLGNYEQVRAAIELELESVFADRKTPKQGLDAAVIRGNAILRQFALTHKPWPGQI